MSLSLLDTDIFTEILKRRNRTVALNASAYLREFGPFAYSAMTRFEVLRGLRHKQASTLLRNFDALVAQSLLFPISDDVLDRAADLWVAARNLGRSHRDADLIIAATALIHGRTLVTGNTSHFDWIAGLIIENWRDS